jgi:hypothetical protein
VDTTYHPTRGGLPDLEVWRRPAVEPIGTAAEDVDPPNPRIQATDFSEVADDPVLTRDSQLCGPR